MNTTDIRAMKPTVQRYMATQTSSAVQGLEQDEQGNIDWEAAATALLLEAYLLLSDKTNPTKAEEFIVRAAQNLKELSTEIVHDDAGP